ncbi:TetR/AcrR family transcriptional regulator [Nocardia jejuensis]|uniref:TetR/AcrR family transcriptional regulator n=1 Tax=Nocardia jejuensis TaxID=328049 RepID=UPI0012FBB6A6|nr:TetR/AcrR family transcriptional regulator [Nocardia jejuensis]
MSAAADLIEEHRPGAEISIQQIAQRAGLARSVVYRQFDNREDLDAHVREFILGRYLAEFESLLVLDPTGTIEAIIADVMRAVVRWAAAHPTLYRFGQAGPVHGHAAGETSLSIARHHIAELLWQRLSSWTAVLGIDVEPFHPLAYGLAGMVEGVVTHYIDTPAATRSDEETIVAMLSGSVWHLFSGHAAEHGFRFEPSDNAAALLGELFAEAAKGRQHTDD